MLLLQLLVQAEEVTEAAARAKLGLLEHGKVGLAGELVDHVGAYSFADFARIAQRDLQELVLVLVLHHDIVEARVL